MASKIKYLMIFAVIVLLDGCNRTSPTILLTPSSILPTLMSTSESNITAPPLPTQTSPNLDIATSKPTMDTDRQEQIIMNLINSNGGCQLPCFWGIMPGKTEMTEALNSFQSLGLPISSLVDREGNTYYWISFDFWGIFHSISFNDINNDDIVDRIDVRLEVIQDTQNLKEIWQPFSPEEIVQEYGEPYNVYLESRAQIPEDPQPDKMDYSIDFHYDVQDFYVSYTGGVENESVYRMCPTFLKEGNLGKSMIIYTRSPEEGSLMKSWIEETYHHFSKDAYKSLEQAVDFDKKRLLELYSSQKIFCFETSKEFWP